MTAIVSAGYDLASAVGAVGDVSYEERRSGGCWQLNWSMPAGVGLNHPALRPGAPVSMRLGAWQRWVGVLDEPDGSDTFTASGLARLAEQYVALNGPNTTSTPDTAINDAIATRALPWTHASFSAFPVVTGDTTDALNFLNTLLDTWANSAAAVWGVDETGHTYYQNVTNPPKWAVTPGAVRLGVTNEDYITDLYLRYQTADDGSLATRHESLPGPWLRREETVNLIPLGTISAARASTEGQSRLAQVGPRPGFTDSLDLSAHQVSTLAGGPAPLEMIRPGDGIRLYGLTGTAADLAGGKTLDITADVIKHAPGSGRITIDPVGKAPRVFSEILAVPEASDGPDT